MSEFLRCRDCKHDKGKCVGSSRRGGHKNCFEPREMTNADRIRSMSDEKLANFIPDWRHTKACKCNEHEFIGCDNQCEKCVLEWLKQPAEEILHG